MIDGVLSEYVLLNETGAIKIPDHLSFEEAATLPCAALTAWNAVIETGQLKAGETVAILGTGGVSMLCARFRQDARRIRLSDVEQRGEARARQKRSAPMP